MIGAFLLVFIYFCLENGKLDFEYLFEDVPKPFLILYGSYLVVRFLIWSFNTLKLKESKTFKNIIYAICILLCICVLVFFFNLYKSYKSEKLNNRMTEMTSWVSVMEVAEISRKKYPDDEYYQEVYKRLDIFNNEFEKMHEMKFYDLIPVNNSNDKLSTEEFRIGRKHRIEEVKMMDKYELDLLLEKSARRNRIHLSYDRNTQRISWRNYAKEELEKLKKGIVERKRMEDAHKERLEEQEQQREELQKKVREFLGEKE